MSDKNIESTNSPKQSVGSLHLVINAVFILAGIWFLGELITEDYWHKNFAVILLLVPVLYLFLAFYKQVAHKKAAILTLQIFVKVFLAIVIVRQSFARTSTQEWKSFWGPLESFAYHVFK